MSTERVRAIINCLDCGKRGKHQGRGLCCPCYCRHKSRGTLWRFERASRPADELLEEWDDLRRQGYSLKYAAERIGVTFAALDKALCRAARRGDPRATRRVVA